MGIYIFNLPHCPVPGRAAWGRRAQPRAEALACWQRLVGKQQKPVQDLNMYTQISNLDSNKYSFTTHWTVPFIHSSIHLSIHPSISLFCLSSFVLSFFLIKFRWSSDLYFPNHPASAQTSASCCSSQRAASLSNTAPSEQLNQTSSPDLNPPGLPSQLLHVVIETSREDLEVGHCFLWMTQTSFKCGHQAKP